MVTILEGTYLAMPLNQGTREHSTQYKMHLKE